MSEPTITREQLQTMDVKDILEAVANKTASAEDANTVLSNQKQADIIQKRVDNGLHIRIQRLGPDQVAHAPRKIRLTGDAIDSPQRARRADEDKDKYFETLPHVTLDCNQLVYLLTACRLPLLKELQAHLGEPDIIDLPSNYGDGVYHRVVSTWQNRDDARVLIGRSSNAEDGEVLLSLIEHALDNVSQAEVSMYSDVSVQSQINEAEVASF